MSNPDMEYLPFLDEFTDLDLDLDPLDQPIVGPMDSTSLPVLDPDMVEETLAGTLVHVPDPAQIEAHAWVHARIAMEAWDRHVIEARLANARIGLPPGRHPSISVLLSLFPAEQAIYSMAEAWAKQLPMHTHASRYRNITAEAMTNPERIRKTRDRRLAREHSYHLAVKCQIAINLSQFVITGSSRDVLMSALVCSALQEATDSIRAASKEARSYMKQHYQRWVIDPP